MRNTLNEMRREWNRPFNEVRAKMNKEVKEKIDAKNSHHA
jgi:hypothetical protein